MNTSLKLNPGFYSTHQYANADLEDTFVPKWQETEHDFRSESPPPPPPPYPNYDFEEDIFPRSGPAPTPTKFPNQTRILPKFCEVNNSEHTSQIQRTAHKSSSLFHTNRLTTHPPIDSLNEAIEQIRILKLGSSLEIGTWPKFQNAVSTLETNVQRTLRLLLSKAPKTGIYNKHQILQQKTTIEREKSTWDINITKLKKVIEMKFSSLDPFESDLTQELKKTAKQVELIGNILLS